MAPPLCYNPHTFLHASDGASPRTARRDNNVTAVQERMKGVRDWIKDYLIPVNTVIIFAGFVVAALDAAAPVARPYTRVLTIGAAAGAMLLLAASLLPLPRRMGELCRGRRWILWFAFLAVFTAGGFFSLAHGRNGALGARFEGIAGVQQSVFDLAQEVRAVAVDTKAARANTEILVVAAREQAQGTAALQEGMARVKRDAQATRSRSEQAAANTEYIRKQMEDPQRAAAEACTTTSCAVAMGASRAVFQRLLNDGARMPAESFGPGLRRLMEERHPNRFDIMDLYLRTGAVPDVNAKAAKVLWSGELQERAARAGAQQPGATGCLLAALRPLELAALVGDREMQRWLLARGADPELANDWCSLMRGSPTFTAAAVAAAMGRR